MSDPDSIPFPGRQPIDGNGGGGRLLESLERRVGEIEKSVGEIREKLGTIQGTLDTLKWGVWMGLAAAGIMGALVGALIP